MPYIDLPGVSADNLIGAVPIANGGTGATTASAALTALGAGRTANIQAFTASGTWTKPPNTSVVEVTVYGAGAGGGGPVRGGFGGGTE